MAYFILQLSIWSILLPLVAGFLFFKQLDESSRVIFIIVVLATIPQLLTVSMLHTKKLNVVYNVYTLLEFSLMYFFIGKEFQNRAFKIASYALIFLFYALALWVIHEYGLYEKFLNELICAANIIYLIWIFLFILQGLLHERNLINAKQPVFWFVAGLLFYTPCSIFVVALANYIQKSTNPFIHNLWSIQGVFNTLMYILFAVGFYKSHLLARGENVGLESK